MVSTYLSSKKVLDSLLVNSQFLTLAKKIVNSTIGSPAYILAYNGLDALLSSLKITYEVNVFKSNGEYSYSNKRTQAETALAGNHNTRPEVFSAVNYRFGNPICNKKLYPLDLQSSVCSGYGFAERFDNTYSRVTQYVAMTYTPTSSPLNNNVFTLRVGQNI